jgi:hypothetical protein
VQDPLEIQDHSLVASSSSSFSPTPSPGPSMLAGSRPDTVVENGIEYLTSASDEAAVGRVASMSLIAATSASGKLASCDS